MKPRLTKEEHAILAVKLNTALRILQRAWIEVANAFPLQDKKIGRVKAGIGKAVDELGNGRFALGVIYEEAFKEWGLYGSRPEYEEIYNRMNDILTEEAQSLNIVTRRINE